MIKAFSVFNLSTITSSIHISKLIDLLAKEISLINKHTLNKSDKDSKRYVHDFLSLTKFKLNEEEESRKMKLEKEDNNINTKVEISFLSMALYNEKRSIINQPNSILDFNVSINKLNHNHEMLFECKSMLRETKYSISSIYTFNSNKNMNTKSLYPYTPNVNSFDIRIKKGFKAYLNELGITKDMLAFIKYLALDKEQRLYKKWLEDITVLL